MLALDLITNKQLLFVFTRQSILHDHKRLKNVNKNVVV